LRVMAGLVPAICFVTCFVQTVVDNE